LVREQEEQRSVAVLKELQPVAMVHLRVECQRRRAELRVTLRVQPLLRLERRKRVEKLEKRRAAVLRFRESRRRLREKEERRWETKDLLLK
jgi:hypothetical protein